MIYSLTDKLNFAENPQIEIKGKVVTVKSDAKTVLKLMEVVRKEGEIDGATKALELLFSEKDRKTIDSFNLGMTDYATLVTTAIALATGEDPDQKPGE